jgi:hypothetical protein
MALGEIADMTLTRTTNTPTTALVVADKKNQSLNVSTPESRTESAPVQGDSIEIRSERPEGGGYDADEIPDDDDGPGAGGGYERLQDPVESDGPGAGGGYFTEQNAYSHGGLWKGPLTVFGSVDDDPHVDVAPYEPGWVQALPQDAFSWTGSGALMLEPAPTRLLLEAPKAEQARGGLAKAEAKPEVKKDGKKG